MPHPVRSPEFGFPENQVNLRSCNFLDANVNRFSTRCRRNITLVPVMLALTLLRQKPYFGLASGESHKTIEYPQHFSVIRAWWATKRQVALAPLSLQALASGFSDPPTPSMNLLIGWPNKKLSPASFSKGSQSTCRRLEAFSSIFGWRWLDIKIFHNSLRRVPFKMMLSNATGRGAPVR